MQMIDILLLFLVAGILAFPFYYRFLYKKKQRKGGCSGCSGCPFENKEGCGRLRDGQPDRSQEPADRK